MRFGTIEFDPETPQHVRKAMLAAYGGAGYLLTVKPGPRWAMNEQELLDAAEFQVRYHEDEFDSPDDWYEAMQTITKERSPA